MATAQHSSNDTEGRRAPATRLPLTRRHWNILGVIALLASVFALGVAWAVSSPVGGSPDDDYHLASIWCTPPLSESGCETGYTEEDTYGPVVPETIASNRVACYAFHGESSAACVYNLSDERTAVTDRWDDGNYPWGYYQFHHHFIAHDTHRAALTMRVINWGIAVLLLGGIGALMPSFLRRGYVVAMAAAWTPMGIYFIASNNPSSWAFSGVLAFAAGLWSAANSEGWRRWSLMGGAAIGALLACTSRADAAFFLFVVSAALIFAVRWRRDRWPEGVLALLASIIGILIMRSTSVASNTLVSTDTPNMSAIQALAANLHALPQFFAGFYGYRWGPGWMDVPYDGFVSTIGLLIAGAIIIAGVRSWSWRKAMTSLMLAGAMAGVPILLGVLQRFNNVISYQPRYMMPLLAVLFFFMLTMDRRERTITRPQVGMLAVFLGTLNFYAIFTLLLRYTHGSASSNTLNLSKEASWWWESAPIGPSAVCLIASFAFIVALTIALLLTREEVSDSASPRD